MMMLLKPLATQMAAAITRLELAATPVAAAIMAMAEPAMVGEEAVLLLLCGGGCS